MPKDALERCNACNRITRHTLQFETEKDWSEDVNEGRNMIWGRDAYALLECNGCGTVHFRHTSFFSEDVGPDNEPEATITYYPPRISRAKPDWKGQFLEPFSFNDPKGSLLDEIYAAMHNGSLRLAAMGIRSLVEMIMTEQVGERGTLSDKIQRFFEAGFVAPVSQETFRNSLVEAGHAAVHRNFKPSVDDLGTLLDLVEGLIASIYVHPERAKGLGKRIPARNKESKGPPSSS